MWTMNDDDYEDEYDDDNELVYHEKKVCPICMGKFEPNEEHKVWCSSRCLKIAAKKLAHAHAKALAKKKSNVNKPSKPKTLTTTPKHTPRLRIRNCAICGAEFSTTNPVQKTCSKECSKTYKKQWQQEYDKAHPKSKRLRGRA